MRLGNAEPLRIIHCTMHVLTMDQVTACMHVSGAGWIIEATRRWRARMYANPAENPVTDRMPRHCRAGAVRGIAVAPSGDVAVSCSTDCSVRLFRLPFAPFASPGPVEHEASAVLEFQGRSAFRAIDHHWTRNTFGTAGAQVLLPSHA